jgi:hypothetical protein
VNSIAPDPRAGEPASAPATGTTVRGRLLLGRVPPADLVDARIQLHHAVQLVSTVGRTLAPREPDFANASLEWSDRGGPVGALVGRAVHAAGDGATVRASLVFDPPSLAIEGPGGETRSLALGGTTLAEAWEWLRASLIAAGVETSGLSQRLPDLPAHPVAEGAAFSLDPSASAELGRWYANADAALRAIGRRVPAAGPVRCWTHHFDLAVLIPVPAGETDGPTPAPARSIGLGFSPGDGSHATPYLYAVPWPPPEAGSLPPAPPDGRWQVEGWVGLALDAEVVLDDQAAPRDEPAAARQADRIEAFLEVSRAALAD